MSPGRPQSQSGHVISVVWSLKRAAHTSINTYPPPAWFWGTERVCGLLWLVCVILGLSSLFVWLRLGDLRGDWSCHEKEKGRARRWQQVSVQRTDATSRLDFYFIIIIIIFRC